ncbi:MAG: hypothetical protein GF398_19675 [Chitinivibrionales bacterium]|nr:hypothetical protein [Chitinivibrionales bacterium]
MQMSRICASLTLLILLSLPLSAQKQVQTEHYVVVFDEGNEFFAHEVILIAEEVWDDLITAYNIYEEYQRIYIYIRDPGDFANGYAIFNKNMITIYTTNLHAGMRGTSSWLRNVVTHELAHVFSLKAARKNLLFENVSLLSNSRYQNPDWAVAMRFNNLLAPRWWAEGIAQYDAYKNGNDFWDTHRDMLLRMAVLEDDLLSYTEMSTFGARSGFHYEMTYNQGYSLVLYIDSVYGESAVRTSATTKSWFNFNRSLRTATGKTGLEIYNDWHAHLKSRYQEQATTIKQNTVEGTPVFDAGFWDRFGAWSPDGKKIGLVSNTGYEIRYPHLFVFDTKTGRSEKLLKPNEIVDTRLQWFPSGEKLLYSRWTKNAPYLDVFTFDLKERREQQITWHSRALDPAVSPDGKTIAFIQNKGGIQNLALIDANGKNERLLTNFANGTQLFAPVWTPDADNIVLSIYDKQDRDIAMVSAHAQPLHRVRKLSDTAYFADSLNFQNDLEFRLLVHTRADERDPALSPDGHYLYFSSDRTGIFNIYRMDLVDGEVEQITNVIGGAFHPQVAPNGESVLYTAFHAANYSVYKCDIDPITSVPLEHEQRYYRTREQNPFIFAGGGMNPESQTRTYQYTATPYKPRFTVWDFSPYLAFEPAVITDKIGDSHLKGGMNFALGELAGYANVQGAAYAGKKLTDRAGLSWGGNLMFNVGVPTVYGDKMTYAPGARAFAYRDVIKNEDHFEPTHPEELEQELVVARIGDFQLDTLYLTYSDRLQGSLRFEDIYNFYGLSGSMQLDRYNSIGLQYARQSVFLNASYHDVRNASWAQVFHQDTDGTYKSVQQLSPNSLAGQISALFTDTTLPYDVPRLYDSFPRYRSHRLGLHYSYVNIRPSFGIPARIDYLSFSSQFTNASHARSEVRGGAVFEDTLSLSGGSQRQVITRLDDAGGLIGEYLPLETRNDYVNFTLSAYERFPLTSNKRISISAQGHVSLLNKRLTGNGNLFPLQLRISRFLKAYPYRFNPLDTVRSSTLPVYLVDPADSLVYSTDIRINGPVTFEDAVDRDILWGNGLLFLNLEASFSLLRDVNVPALGMLLRDILLTPFVEAATVWNENLPDLRMEHLIGNSASGNFGNFLRDAGLRLDMPMVLFNNWQALLSLTAVMRLDLDDEIAGIEYNQQDGSITLSRLDKFRFSIVFQMVNW